MNTITDRKLENLLELYDLVSKEKTKVGFSPSYEVRLSILDESNQVNMIPDTYKLLAAPTIPSFVSSKKLKKAVLTILRKEIKKAFTHSIELEKRAYEIIKSR